MIQIVCKTRRLDKRDGEESGGRRIALADSEEDERGIDDRYGDVDRRIEPATRHVHQVCRGPKVSRNSLSSARGGTYSTAAGLSVRASC